MNIVILGISCLEGMAGTRRVRNLIDPLMSKKYITVSNLIYKIDSMGRSKVEGSEEGINFKLIGFTAANIFSLFRFCYSGCMFLLRAKARDKKNILYHYDSPDIKNIVFILFAKSIGYRIIFDLIEDHRFAPEYNSLLYKFRTSTSVFFLKKIRFFADGIIVISQHLYNRLFFITRNKISLTLIPISVDLKYFNRPRAQVISDDVKIFYGGSFGEKDGLEYLIKAFDEVCYKYNNATLILTGKGTDIQEQKINKLINRAVHSRKIFYRGYLPAKEYYHVLNDCDIFCMTRNNSSFASAGFPFKLGEFLAVGKAVIASDVGDVSFYLKNGLNAYVISPESVSELVDALSRVISDPDKILALGAESKKTAEKYFDSEMLSLRLYRIFEKL
jgi:glycosyltransferase involved in cell wall biosynthesis